MMNTKMRRNVYGRYGKMCNFAGSCSGFLLHWKEVSPFMPGCLMAMTVFCAFLFWHFRTSQLLEPIARKRDEQKE